MSIKEKVEFLIKSNNPGLPIEIRETIGLYKEIVEVIEKENRSYEQTFDSDEIDSMDALIAKIKAMKKEAPKPKRLFNKEDRVKNVKDGKVGTIYGYDERGGAYYYRINWDNSRIAQAGVPESLLEKYSKPKSTAKAKAAAKASTTVKKATASRKATAKPRVKKETSSANTEKAATSAKAKTTAKPKAPAKPKAATKAKSTKPVEPAKPITRTQVETPEHKQIKRFLAIRKNETVQLAMTAYKSLQKDIAERKIRAVSPQASIIKGIQLAYYKYITGQTNSLTLSEAILKEANEFVGSQKPYETVALVKRFIGWTGQGKTEKQIADYLKEAEKVISAARENDPYYDELKAIIKALKSTKAGDVVVADNVGLSGLRSNTIKIRK